MVPSFLETTHLNPCEHQSWDTTKEEAGNRPRIQPSAAFAPGMVSIDKAVMSARAVAI
jgi:hypothetical protein